MKSSLLIIITKGRVHGKARLNHVLPNIALSVAVNSTSPRRKIGYNHEVKYECWYQLQQNGKRSCKLPMNAELSYLKALSSKLEHLKRREPFGILFLQASIYRVRCIPNGLDRRPKILSSLVNAAKIKNGNVLTFLVRMGKLVEKILGWSGKKRSKAEKFAALALGAVIFAFLLPCFFVLEGRLLDSFLGIQKLLPEPVNLIVGLLLVIIGWPFAIWSVYVQYKIGEGTPAPVVPTKRLITSGPYKYCRNPMAFGTLLFYVGLSIIFNSISTLFILIPLVLVPVLVFIKIVEEKELEVRFGREYVEYKQRTPFLIPRLSVKRK